MTAQSQEEGKHSFPAPTQKNSIYIQKKNITLKILQFCVLTWANTRTNMVVFRSSWPRIPGFSIYRNVASEPGACPARTGRNMTRDNEPKLARASSGNRCQMSRALRSTCSLPHIAHLSLTIHDSPQWHRNMPSM